MRIPFAELKSIFKEILLRHSFDDRKAEICATIFAENSRDGVHSHGLNRFPVFIQQVRDGFIKVNEEPELIFANGAIEEWDGRLAPGMYNARHCMQRAIDLAKENGIAMVTVKNTNHWMRAGSYGWQAADAGCVGICTTNTIANMPPWGGRDVRLGNNPLVIAVPVAKGHVVLDMAASQYSYGALQEYELNHKMLPEPGGYDAEGNLSRDPASIRETGRVLPIGFWKGSGLSLVLDVLLTALTGGLSVKKISEQKSETGISQLFICIYKKEMRATLLDEIIDYAKSSSTVEPGGKIYYPGEKTLITRKESMEKGVLVNEEVWNRVLKI